MPKLAALMLRSLRYWSVGLVSSQEDRRPVLYRLGRTTSRQEVCTHEVLVVGGISVENFVQLPRKSSVRVLETCSKTSWRTKGDIFKAGGTKEGAGWLYLLVELAKLRSLCHVLLQ